LDHPLDRREFIKIAGAAAAALTFGGADALAQAAPPETTTGKSLYGFTTPPMERVRMGFVGTGGRGTSLLRNFLEVGNVEAVMDGDLEAFIKAYLHWARERAA